MLDGPIRVPGRRELREFAVTSGLRRFSVGDRELRQFDLVGVDARRVESAEGEAEIVVSAVLAAVRHQWLLGTGAVAVTGTGAVSVLRTAVATSEILVSASGTATRNAVATAAASLAVTTDDVFATRRQAGAGAASVAVTGTLSATVQSTSVTGSINIVVTGTAAAGRRQVAAGTAAVAVTTTADATKRQSAAATAAIAVTSSAAASRRQTAAATAAVAVTTTADATRRAFAEAAASIAITGTLSADVESSAVTGNAAIVVTGTAAASRTQTAAATAAIAVTTAGAATRTQAAIGDVVAIDVAGTGAAALTAGAAATASIAVTGTAAASLTAGAAAAASIAVTGTAAATRGQFAEATAALAVTTADVAATRTQAAEATAAVVITGTASADVESDAVTGNASIAVTATAAATRAQVAAGDTAAIAVTVAGAAAREQTMAAAASIAVTATAAATLTQTAAATAAIAVTTSGAATRNAVATATAAIAVTTTGAATLTQRMAATAATAVTVTGAATRRQTAAASASITVTATGTVVVDFTPAIHAIWFDTSDLATMKQERTGASATTAAAVDAVVGSHLNKGTKGGWAVAASDAARPILRQSGALYYLEYDGTGDYLALPTPAVGLVDLEAFAAFEETSYVANSGVVVLAPSSGNDYDSTGGIAVFTTGFNSTNQVQCAGGTSLAILIRPTGTTPTPNAVYEFRWGDGTDAHLYIDGVLVETDSTTDTFASVNSGDLYIGARFLSGAVSAAYLTGRIRQIVISDVTLSSGDRISVREFVAAKAGVALDARGAASIAVTATAAAKLTAGAAATAAVAVTATAAAKLTATAAATAAVAVAGTCDATVTPGGISFIAGGGADGTTITIPGTEQSGDLILIAAAREANVTPPTLPGTPAYTNIIAPADVTNSMRVGYRIATSGAETSGTWTNASCLAAVLMRGVNQTTPIGNISSAHTTATGTTSFVAPAVALTSGHGNRNHVAIALFVMGTTTITWPTISGFTLRGSIVATGGGNDPGAAIYISDSPLSADFSETTSNADGSFSQTGTQIAVTFEIRAV